MLWTVCSEKAEVAGCLSLAAWQHKRPGVGVGRNGGDLRLDELCVADRRSLLLKGPAHLRSFAPLYNDLLLEKPVPRPFKINGVFAWLDVGDRGGSQPFRLRLACSAFIVRDEQ